METPDDDATTTAAAGRLFRLCGQVDVADGSPTVRVFIKLEAGPAGYVLDPTTRAVMSPTAVFTATIEPEAGGRWVTDALPATSAADPNEALQPAGTTYQVTVTANGAIALHLTEFDLNAETAAAAAATDETGCVPIDALA